MMNYFNGGNEGVDVCADVRRINTCRGKDWKGKERIGKEWKGLERKGKDWKGKDWKGKEKKKSKFFTLRNDGTFL
jgi:hypothetical protein